MDGYGKVRKIAEYMGLSERTVRDLLKRGLRHSRMETGTILIRYQHVDSFLKQYEVTGNEVDQAVDSVLKEFANGS